MFFLGYFNLFKAFAKLKKVIGRGVPLKISQGWQTPKNLFQEGQTPKNAKKILKTLRISRLLPFFSIFRGQGGGQAFTLLIAFDSKRFLASFMRFESIF